MGVEQSSANIARTHAMVSTQSFIAPLIELARDESVQSKVLDVARQFFSNSNITINLIPALIAGGLLLLLLLLILRSPVIIIWLQSGRRLRGGKLPIPLDRPARLQRCLVEAGAGEEDGGAGFARC